MTIGNRIKEERAKQGMNQTDFAAIGGVTKKTQADYEKGATSPTAKYLEAIAAAGADVQYILTGQRAAPLHPTSEEEALLMMYRSMSKAQHRVILRACLRRKH